MGYNTLMAAVMREVDLNTSARIRNAALEGFAKDGVAATSIRDVADAAGVSAGLVQHHFRTKAGLRDAVNEYVVSIVAEAFGDVSEMTDPADPLEVVGNRITAVVRDHPVALLYAARSLVDGDEDALGIFDILVEIAIGLLRRLEEQGHIKADVDLEWAALHVVVLNLGTVLFQMAIDRRLEKSFFDEEELERWNHASKALFRRGVFKSPRRRSKRS
jgi:AcrR family transcriptional regulator